MVFAFLAIALTGPSGGSILHTSVFGHDPAAPTQQQQPAPTDGDDERLARQRVLDAITQRLLSECAFHAAVAALPEEVGAVMLPAGTLFSTPKTVVWRRERLLLTAVVCERHEQLALAGLTLTTINRVLRTYCASVADHPAEALVKLDEFNAIVKAFLPSGLMLFLNAALTAHIAREVELMLTAKS